MSSISNETCLLEEGVRNWQEALLSLFVQSKFEHEARDLKGDGRRNKITNF